MNPLTPRSTPYALLQAQGYVHVRWPDRFEVSLHSMMAMWPDVCRLCRATRRRRVLVEGYAPRRVMRPVDAFQHGAFIATLESPGLRIAFCLQDFDPDVITWVFTRTAQEGPCQLEFFRHLPAARRWIGMGGANSAGKSQFSQKNR